MKTAKTILQIVGVIALTAALAIIGAYLNHYTPFHF